MKNVILLLLLAVCYSGGDKHKQDSADPYGLKIFGFEKKLETRPLVMPAQEPPNSKACGLGVYVRDETISLDKKMKKIKVVIVYFLPNPSTLTTFEKYVVGSIKPSATKESATQELSGLPLGVSSLTFFWPPQLRNVQRVLLMRAEKVNNRRLVDTFDPPVQLDVREGNSPSILWKYDDSVPGLTYQEAVKFRISLPKGAEKCIKGK